MTAIDDHPTPAPTAARPPRHLLLWDGPNIDMRLSALLGCKPDPTTRPNFGAVARWLCRRALPGDTVEACVFTNVAPDAVERMRPWVNAVRDSGFAVFARPKLTPDDDIDDDIVAHIRSRQAEGPLAEVVIASHDFAAFEDVLRELAASGTRATVLGFFEFAGGALRTPEIQFVDLEDVPAAFTTKLPRVDLDNLPPAGQWFPPTLELEPLGDAGNDLTRLTEVVRVVVAESGEPVFLASVGSRLRTAIPGFDHRSFGYGSLQSLVADLADDAGVEVISIGDQPAVRLGRPNA